MPTATPDQDTNTQRLQAGLREIRGRRRLSHVPFFVVAALALFLSVLRGAWPSFSGSFGEKLAIGLLGIAFLPALISMMFVSVINLRCPRCREFFHAAKGRYRNDFARKCLNCGLRLDGKNASDAF